MAEVLYLKDSPEGEGFIPSHRETVKSLFSNFGQRLIEAARRLFNELTPAA